MFRVTFETQDSKKEGDKDSNVKQGKDKEAEREVFRISLETRNFEIELFWKRALFFWGFIASTFIAFAYLQREDNYYSILVANFGMVCSLAWTLANRGSKYWQENWERKVSSSEEAVTGALFKQHEPVQNKGCWLSARRYSVSKLAIALSDYLSLFWASVVLLSLFKLYPGFLPFAIDTSGLLLAASISSLAYCILMLCKCKTSQP